MITAVAFVCTVLVTGLTLWAWFKGTGQELDATVDRVLTSEVYSVLDHRNPCLIADKCVYSSQCEQYQIYCRPHAMDLVVKKHHECRQRRRDGLPVDCVDCRPVVLQ